VTALDRPTIGLALGSGGARGLAHLGVIKVFQEENIPIDYLAGSSIGALVAALVSAGQSIDKLYKIAVAVKRKYFLDFTRPKLGFIAGNRILEMIRIFTFHKNIEDLSVPLAIVATDLHTGERVVFREGPVAEAVRASISIPGVFVPAEYRGRLLVDGGVTDRIPVSAVKEMGADIVIGVNISGFTKNARIHSIYDVFFQSLDIMQAELTENRKLLADLMIHPEVDKFSSYAFTDVEAIISAGEAAARKQMPRIQKLIQERRESIT
jgi:NTE family protein